jgi:hypothetical protein
MQVDSLFRLGPAAVVAGALATCAATAAVTISGSTSDYVVLEVLARVLTVAAPVAVGLYALRHRTLERFGMLLVVSGLGWFLATLANSDDAVVYSIGRV